jgi:NADPH:quinone reductase-like Zn-dependent oxidoreductase
MLYRASGGPEVLEYTEVADPVPGPGDVVLDVTVTALNRLDVSQRNGWYHAPGFAFPHIAGMDIAGVVSEVGSEATQWQPGDRVIADASMVGVADNSKYAGLGDPYRELGILGATLDGGYAEKCLVPATHCYRVPDHIAMEQAVTFPTVWMTAGNALFAAGELTAGETVMIHAAGSGVSVAGIQLAKNAGATVLATAGTDSKCALALELGADYALNNRTGDVTGWAMEVTEGRGVDMVFDHVGTALFTQSLFSLAIRGRLVNTGNASGDTATIGSLGHLFHMGIRIIGSDLYRPEAVGPLWDTFCEGVASGRFAAVVDSEFPLTEAGAAQQKMQESDFFGKILLRP